jgi:hypothetical protein
VLFTILLPLLSNHIVNGRNFGHPCIFFQEVVSIHERETARHVISHIWNMICYAFHALMFLKAYFTLHLPNSPSKYQAAIMLKAFFQKTFDILSIQCLSFKGMWAVGCNSTPQQGIWIQRHVIKRLLLHPANDRCRAVHARMEQHSVKLFCKLQLVSLQQSIQHSIYRLHT